MENDTGPQHDHFLSRSGHFFVQDQKQRVVSIIFDIIGFMVSVGLVFMGYTYGKVASDRILASSSSKAMTETPYPTRQVLPTRPIQKAAADCASEFQQMSLRSIELCLPEFFTKESNSNTSVRFRGGDDEFVVNIGSLEQFAVHVCHLEKDVIVNGNIATRTIFRQETVSGCGDIIGFATTIYDTPEGNVQFHLWKNSGTYTNEEIYEKIERSAKF